MVFNRALSEDEIKAIYNSTIEDTLAYDDNGNLSVDTYGRQYTYDCENQLVSVTLAEDTEITYKYDAFGRRVEKTVDDGETETTTKFIYDGFEVVAEYDGGGKNTKVQRAIDNATDSIRKC